MGMRVGESRFTVGEGQGTKNTTWSRVGRWERSLYPIKSPCGPCETPESCQTLLDHTSSPVDLAYPFIFPSDSACPPDSLISPTDPTNPPNPSHGSCLPPDPLADPPILPAESACSYLPYLIPTYYWGTIFSSIITFPNVYMQPYF